MVIKAIICLVFGVCFVLIPKPILSLYGITLDPAGVYMTRLFGAAFILLSILLWFARKDPGSEALKALVLAVFIGDVIGFVIALLTQLTGLVNALGWLNIALYFLLALGFGYFQFKKPAKA
jgi:uncharacterized membrane protein YfcA